MTVMPVGHGGEEGEVGLAGKARGSAALSSWSRTRSAVTCPTRRPRDELAGGDVDVIGGGDLEASKESAVAVSRPGW